MLFRSQDPIALVRRQARESLLEIVQRARLAGESVPEIVVPEPLDFAALYPPRGIEGWAGVAVEKKGPASEFARSAEDLLRGIDEGLRPEHFRNLNNAQARGAEHMMISGIASFAKSVDLLAEEHPEAFGEVLGKLLETPYPVAQDRKSVV